MKGGRPERFSLIGGYPILAPVLRWTRNLALYCLGNGAGVDPEISGERHVMKRVNPHNGLILDVGAHQGEWARTLLAIQPNAFIISFEPGFSYHELIYCPVVAAYQVAIGSFNGKAYLSGEGMTAHLSDNKGEPVTVRTLDSFNYGAVELLKIDVEGAEIEVLKGATETLKRTRMVQWEMGPGTIEFRAYLKDFFRILGPDFTIYRIQRGGLCEIPRYDEHEEGFLCTNYVAIRRQS